MFSFQRQRGVDPKLRALGAAPAAARPQRLAVHGGGGGGEEPRHGEGGRAPRQEGEARPRREPLSGGQVVPIDTRIVTSVWTQVGKERKKCGNTAMLEISWCGSEIWVCARNRFRAPCPPLSVHVYTLTLICNDYFFLFIS